MRDNDKEPRQKDKRPCRRCVGYVGRCSQWTQGEEPSRRFERKKVIGDESARHFYGRIGKRMLQQVCEASSCRAKIWVIVKQGKLTNSVQVGNPCKHIVGVVFSSLV